MSYTGTLLRDLLSVVDGCLQQSGRICAHSEQCCGDHHGVDAHCPDPASTDSAYLQTKSAERGAEERITARTGTAKALQFGNVAS